MKVISSGFTMYWEKRNSDTEPWYSISSRNDGFYSIIDIKGTISNPNLQIGQYRVKVSNSQCTSPYSDITSVNGVLLTPPTISSKNPLFVKGNQH